MLSLRLFIAAVVLLAFTAFGAVQVKYSNCTDEAFCVSGCQSATVATEQCLAFSSASEVIVCDPVLSVVGDLSYFTQPDCTNLWFTNAFVCGYCQGPNVNNSYSQVLCDSKDGAEYIAIYSCQGNAKTNATGRNCNANCSNPWNVTKGQCIPTTVSSVHVAAFHAFSQHARLASSRTPHLAAKPAPKQGQQMYAMYTGATLSTTVRVTQWLSNSKCQGTPTVNAAWPDKSCIHGASLQCLY